MALKDLAKFNPKEIDWKQFFLQYGERIGLYAAVAVMALLIVFGLVLKTVKPPLQGLHVSAAANAEDLTKQATDKKRSVQNSQPSDEDKQSDPQLLAAVNPKPVDGVENRLQWPWFEQPSMEDTRWRPPEVLAPVRFTAYTMRAPVGSFYYNENMTKVYFRQEKDVKEDPKDRDKRRRLSGLSMLGGGGMMGGGMRGGMMMGGMSGMGMGGMSGMGMGGMSGMGMSGGMGMGGMSGMGMSGGMGMGGYSGGGMGGGMSGGMGMGGGMSGGMGMSGGGMGGGLAAGGGMGGSNRGGGGVGGGGMGMGGGPGMGASGGGNMGGMGMMGASQGMQQGAAAGQAKRTGGGSNRGSGGMGGGGMGGGGMTGMGSGMGGGGMAGGGMGGGGMAGGGMMGGGMAGGGMMGGGMAGGGMMGGGMMGRGGMMGMSGGLGGYGMNDSNREVTLTPVPVEKVDEAKGEPAQIVIPYHMAVIEGAFPYREQLERFAHSLKYPSVQAMLGDRERVFIDKTDKDPTIGFVGFNVVRREVRPDGTAGEWHPVDLMTPYKLMRRRAVKPNHAEDPELVSYGLIVTEVPAPGLVMRLPELVADKDGNPHPGLEYPKLDLPEIRAALEKEKEAHQGKPPSQKPGKNRFNTDPDDDLEEGQGSGAAGGGQAPAAGAMQQKMMNGNKPGAVGVPQGDTEGADAATRQGEIVLPEYCLVRLVDLTIQPGVTYEYQVALVMDNPLYKRLDMAAARAYTRNRVLVGPPRLVTMKAGSQERPLQIRTDPDLSLYAVDDKGDRRQAGRQAPADRDHAPVQLQRWLQTLRLDPTNKDSEVLVGDWAVQKRILVQRGEYIGRYDRVPVAYFDPRANDFVFAASPDSAKRRGRKQKEGALVDFDTHSILVDFEGGPGTQPRVNNHLVSDEVTPSEMLILQLDPYDDSKPPKLLVHHGQDDAQNPDRQRRLQDTEAWQKQIKEGAKEADKGDNPKRGKKKGGGLYDQ
jgi:hypothetical protein